MTQDKLSPKYSGRFISTNTQNSCFTTVFNLNQFQSSYKTAYRRPVTATASKQNSLKKVCTKPKSEGIHHKIQKNHSPTQYFHPITIKHLQSAPSKSVQITQNPFKSPNSSATEHPTTKWPVSCNTHLQAALL